MLDNTYFFECKCGAAEHTIRFILDKEYQELYTEVFLESYLRWYKRIWVAIKFIFGISTPGGHFGCWIMNEEDVDRLKKMIEDFEEGCEENKKIIKGS